jgi:outer membrane protein OmpA-like peptidoglycan-associated protein
MKNDSHQIFASTLTDLMTSLAVIFILLLVVFLKNSHDQSKNAKDKVSSELSAFLKNESLSLHQDPDDPLRLVVMVGEDQLRFPHGDASLSGAGRSFVNGFFKTFSQKICDDSLRTKIDSILIEGHTDTTGEKTPEGVRHNIFLSQKRAYSVLEEALKTVQLDAKTYECLLKLTSANGRGSRNPILVEQKYDPDKSRRVEIKIRVRSSEQQFKEMAQVESTQSSENKPDQTK